LILKRYSVSKSRIFRTHLQSIRQTNHATGYQLGFRLLESSPFGRNALAIEGKVTVNPMTQESLQIEPGLKWYAIRIKVNRERDVEKRLRDLHLEVFQPWMRARRRIGSKFHWVQVPLFPGYIFCRLDMVLSGKAARYSPGVKDFLSFGSRIAEVGEDIIDALRERCPDGIAQIDSVRAKPGDTVRINEGPFSGLEAIFEQKLKGSERVAVLLDILGRQTRIVLPSETIARV
jgi:transcriptional antiterminator RfaH